MRQLVQNQRHIQGRPAFRAGFLFRLFPPFDLHSTPLHPFPCEAPFTLPPLPSHSSLRQVTPGSYHPVTNALCELAKQYPSMCESFLSKLPLKVRRRRGGCKRMKKRMGG
jgi:hypothetical protein